MVVQVMFQSFGFYSLQWNVFETYYDKVWSYFTTYCLFPSFYTLMTFLLKLGKMSLISMGFVWYYILVVSPLLPDLESLPFW